MKYRIKAVDMGGSYQWYYIFNGLFDPCKDCWSSTYTNHYEQFSLSVARIVLKSILDHIQYINRPNKSITVYIDICDT